MIVLSVLPLTRFKHWAFRGPEFAKIQILILQVLTVIWSFFIWNTDDSIFLILWIATLCVIGYHAYILIEFTPLVKNKNNLLGHRDRNKPAISILSANVLQDNTQYSDFLNLVHKNDPDIILTMESNHAWKEALAPLEEKYPHNILIPLENTYGMLFYSKLEIAWHEVQYLISDEIPSIEAKVLDSSGKVFTFIGIHPPPPSPSEEDTSKVRDAEMMKLAEKLYKRSDETIMVVGDFNNVAWAKSSRRFRKVSGLIDPRRGRGLVSTFPTWSDWLAVPIDLMYHSRDIFILNFNKLEDFGSDHYPLLCNLVIETEKAENFDEDPTVEDFEKMQEDIQEGHEADKSD